MITYLIRRLALVVVFILFCTQSANAKVELILGVHPYLPASDILAKFDPLAKYLSSRLGQNVVIEIAKNYEGHIEKMGNNNIDIAYVGPASYVNLVKRYGVKPLLARLEINGAPTFQGMIVAGKDSSVTSLSDLYGKSFAFGDPQSTMSHLVPRYMLLKEGIDISKLKTYSFMSNHQNVVLGVLMGDFDAGAVKEETYINYRDRGLKIIKKTPIISEHLFVASSTLSAKTVQNIKNALLELSTRPEGPAALRNIKKTVTGLVAVSDSDYDNLRDVLSTLESTGVSP